MKLLFEKRKFKKSLFFAQIFILKLFFHEKCPELGKLQYVYILKKVRIFALLIVFIHSGNSKFCLKFSNQF